MNRREITKSFLNIVESIFENDKKQLKEHIRNFDIESIDDEYFYELFITMKNTVCTKSPTYSKEFCLETILEIADVYELNEVTACVEGHIEPEQGLIFCPNCNTVIHNTDEYFRCECGWTNNY